MSEPILSLARVGKSYGLASGERVEVLRDITLDIMPGESMAITGPSGSGKSTLLNLLGALDHPSAGVVRFEGRDLAQLSEPECSDLRNRRIGFIFQRPHLLPQCTALENVLVPTLVARPQRSGLVQRAGELLALMEMSHRADFKPARLSGGEQLRVAIARALILSPAVLLADEPTGSLDRQGSERVAAILQGIKSTQGTTLVIVTHSPDLAERQERRYRLRDGVLVRGDA